MKYYKVKIRFVNLDAAGNFSSLSESAYTYKMPQADAVVGVGKVILLKIAHSDGAFQSKGIAIIEEIHGQVPANSSYKTVYVKKVISPNTLHFGREIKRELVATEAGCYDVNSMYPSSLMLFNRANPFMQNGLVGNIADSIKDIYYNEKKGTVTIVWQDETSTVVKTARDDEFDLETGIAMAITKKVTGSRSAMKKLITQAKKQ